MNKIILKNITKSFSQKVILNNISYTFNLGSLYIIKGKSGCGKSTLLSLVGMLDSPTSGEILIDEQDLSDASSVVSFNTSYLFQDNNVIETLSCYDYLLLTAASKTRSELLSILKKVGILSKEKKLVKTLSKGEEARLALAQIILEDKPLILLDEPLGNLDKDNATIVFKIIQELSTTHLVIMTCHNELDYQEASYILLSLEGGNLIEDVTHLVMKETENIIVPTYHYRNKLSIKQSLNFTFDIIKRNPFKYGFSLLLFTVFSFIALLMLEIMSSNPSKQIGGLLSSHDIPYIELSPEFQSPFLYRHAELDLFDGSKKPFKLPAIYSDSDKIQLSKNSYQLSENELLVPQILANEQGIKNLEALSLSNSIPLKVRIIEDSFSSALISYSSIQSLATQKEIPLFDHELSKELQRFNHAFDFLSIDGVVNSDYVKAFNSSSNNLEGNEVNLVFPLKAFEYPPSIEKVFKSVEGKTFILTEKNEPTVYTFNSEVSIKGYLLDPSSSLLKIQVSDNSFNKVTKNPYQSGIISDLGVQRFLLTEPGFSKINFKNLVFNFEGDTLLKNDIDAINQIYIMMPYVIGIFIFDLILIFATLYIILEGISKSNSKNKLWLYTHSFTYIDVASINLMFYLLISLPTILISTSSFLLLQSSINNWAQEFWRSNNKMTLASFSFNSLLFIFAYIIIFALLGFTFRNSKDSSKIIEKMKKNLE